MQMPASKQELVKRKSNTVKKSVQDQRKKPDEVLIVTYSEANLFIGEELDVFLEIVAKKKKKLF